MSETVLTVVRLPGARGHDPVERIITTVGRVDLGLADELHRGATIRPYAVARRRDTLDVICGRDAIAQALLRGESGARLVTRRRLTDCVVASAPSRYLTVAFQAPTLFHVAGVDHLLPEPRLLFGSLIERWKTLDEESTSKLNPLRVGAQPRVLLFRSAPAADGQERRGFLGVVRYDLIGVSEEERAGAWTLARFGEYRGVGRHTSYGFGRLRLIGEHERWTPEEAREVWEDDDGRD